MLKIYIYIYIGINAHVTIVHGRTECEDRAILKRNSQFNIPMTEVLAGDRGVAMKTTIATMPKRSIAWQKEACRDRKYCTKASEEKV